MHRRIRTVTSGHVIAVAYIPTTSVHCALSNSGPGSKRLCKTPFRINSRTTHLVICTYTNRTAHATSFRVPTTGSGRIRVSSTGPTGLTRGGGISLSDAREIFNMLGSFGDSPTAFGKIHVRVNRNRGAIDVGFIRHRIATSIVRTTVGKLHGTLKGRRRAIAIRVQDKTTFRGNFTTGRFTGLDNIRLHPNSIVRRR